MKNTLQNLVITKTDLKLKNAILKSLRKSEPNMGEDEEPFKVGFILLLVANTGMNLKDIKRISGYEDSFLNKTLIDMKRVGLWKNGQLVHSGWMDKESGGIAFWLDVATVSGLLERKSFNQHKCKHPKCRHEWVQRGKKEPKICPKCKRPILNNKL